MGLSSLINECAAFSKVKKEQQLALGDIPLKIFRALDCCKNRQYIPNGGGHVICGLPWAGTFNRNLRLYLSRFYMADI